MRKILTTLAVWVALSNQALAGTCAEKYLSRAHGPEEYRRFGDLLRDMLNYKLTLKVVDQNHAEALAYTAVALVGAPFILILEGGMWTYQTLDAKYHKQIGEALAGRNSRHAARGLSRMYRLIQNDIEIEEAEFRDFIASISGGHSLCNEELKDGLSQKGQEIVGDEGFMIWASRTVNTPEWDKFFNDPDNWSNFWSTEPLEESQLQQALIRELIKKGYPRKTATDSQDPYSG